MPILIEMTDGTKKEVPTDEELKEIQDKAERRKTQRDELKNELAQTKEELEKLKNKDFNFKKLRDMSEEERRKLTETEIQLKKKQEELEESQKKFTSSLIDSYKNEALAVLAGDDEKLREKVKFNFDRIKGEAMTKEQVNAKMREAFNMLGMTAPKVNPILSAYGASGGSGTKPSKPLNEGQIELAKKLGLSEEDIKNLK